MAHFKNAIGHNVWNEAINSFYCRIVLSEKVIWSNGRTGKIYWKKNLLAILCGECFNVLYKWFCVYVNKFVLLEPILDMIDRFEMTRGILRIDHFDVRFNTNKTIILPDNMIFFSFKMCELFNLIYSMCNKIWFSKLAAILFKYIIENGTIINYLHHDITFISLIEMITFNCFPSGDHHTLILILYIRIIE